MSSLLVSHGLPKGALGAGVLYFSFLTLGRLVWGKLGVGEGGRGRWASRRSAGNWCWMFGMFPASSFTPFSSLHLSGPKFCLKGNNINASPVVPIPGWRGSGLEFSVHGRCGGWASAGRA